MMNHKPSAALVAVAALVLLATSTPLFAQSPYFPDFSSAANLAFNGSAVAPLYNGTTNVLRLTPTMGYQAGSTWFKIKQPVAGGFSTTFKFQISNNQSKLSFPADGFAFVIQNSTSGTSALGPTGAGIGYGSNPDTTGAGITNSLAVEFDTYQNSTDPNANHVAVQSCGTGANSSDENAVYGEGETPCNLALNSSLPLTLADGAVHTVTIEYEPPCTECTNGTLHITLDGTDLFPNGVSVNLATLLSLDSGKAWVGFTGATGAVVENNDILSWSFTPHTGTSITQTIEPGVQAKFIFGSYNYKLTPDPSTNTGGDVLRITTVLIDPGLFDPGPNFPGAHCIVYQDTGGKCVEFQADCLSGPDCKTGTYPLETNYDVPPDTTITNPGFLTAPGQPCPPPSTNPFSRNIITEFNQTRNDPVTKGSGGPGYNCFVAVEDVSYPNADLALGKFAPASVSSGRNLTYAIGVLNQGPGTAQGVVITDPLPAGTSFVSAIIGKSNCTFGSCSLPPPGSTPCSFDAGSNTVTCSVATLTRFSFSSFNGVSVQIVVKVNAAAGSVLSNTATVHALNHDPKPGNNSYTAVTRVTE